MDKYGYGIGSSGLCEIEELLEEEDDHRIVNNNNRNDHSNTVAPHQDHDHAGSSSMGMIGGEEEEEECVYVCVGKGDTSMEALSWTLNNLVKQDSTTVYLIHVFPEIKLIPNPLGAGMMPKSKVSSEQVESYMAQERANRRDLLHKFIQSCSSSKVKVDTILIESDFIAKAILDLIPILHIRNLVIGATKNPRKSSSRKWNGSIADQIQQNAPESCKLRIICEGKEVINDEQQQMMMPTNSPQPPIPHHQNDNDDDDQHHHLPSCICFKPKFR